MKKALIISAAALVALGLILMAAALVTSRFDFSRLSTEKYQTITHTVSGDFQNIEISTREADIVFMPSSDGSCSVVCREREKVPHTVTCEDGTLRIRTEDQREAMDHISFFTLSQSVTVYLPAGAYEKLTVSSGTGDLQVPASFSFAGADIRLSTADADFKAPVSGLLKIHSGTGRIRLSDVQAGEIALSVSTGKIHAESVQCEGSFSADVGTGDTILSKVRCGSFLSSGSTGDLKMKDVAAAGSLSVERSTGDVTLESCDAGEITIRTTTGDVKGTLLTEKVFLAKANTGRVRVPETVTGGPCRITTSTGDIDISIAGK